MSSARAILSLKLLLILEMAFAGIYLALTRNLLVIYLTSIGFDVGKISLVTLIATAIASLISVILWRFSGFLTRRVKLKLLLFHAFERIFWVPMVLVKDLASIAALYAMISASTTIITAFMNLLIYSSFDESGVRDVTAKRTIAGNLMSIIGSAAAMMMLAILPRDLKFAIIFVTGSMIGLLATLMLSTADMRHLEGIKVPKRVGKPEQMFSISSFLLTMLTSSNLLGIVWTPYLMGVLGAPDYLAAAMNFVSTIFGIMGSFFWARRSLRSFRLAIGSLMLVPIAAFITPIPTAHLGITAFGTFMFTGANFLGNFLFARYLREFGAVRSSIMLSMLTNLSQLLATPFGMLFSQDYMLLFASVIFIRLLSVILAFLTVPEVAAVPEEVARTYSQLIYTNSLMGYSYILETSKEVIALTVRLLALATVLALLYILYKFIFFLAGV
ncbi:MAG: hypothetical protein LZ169_04475 [Thaumarchaeota archaeon]|nr:hypothetical protein [Candidatus Wolframiiraptor allenii]